MVELTDLQRQYLESASLQLKALLDGTLIPADGRQVSDRQIVSQLRSVIEECTNVADWITRERIDPQ